MDYTGDHDSLSWWEMARERDNYPLTETLSLRSRGAHAGSSGIAATARAHCFSKNVRSNRLEKTVYSHLGPTIEEEGALKPPLL